MVQWQSIPRSICDWHLDWHSINTRSTSPLTLNQQPVDSWPSVNQLISLCINRKLVNSALTVSRDVDGMLIECQLSCRLSVDWVSTECRSRFNRGYQSRVSIDTWVQMPLVHIIPDSYYNITYRVLMSIKSLQSTSWQFNDTVIKH